MYCSIKHIYHHDIYMVPEQFSPFRKYTKLGLRAQVSVHDGNACARHRRAKRGSENGAELVKRREGGEQRRGERKSLWYDGCRSLGPRWTWLG